MNNLPDNCSPRDIDGAHGYDDTDDYYPESDDWWFDSPPANIEMQPNIAIIRPEEQP